MPTIDFANNDPWRTSSSASTTTTPHFSYSVSSPSHSSQNDDMLQSKSRLTFELSDIMSKYIDIDSILDDETLSEDQKRKYLQIMFWAAASSSPSSISDYSSVEPYLVAPGSKYVDIDVQDEGMVTALMYAACFGNRTGAKALLKAGANTDLQDKHEWTALMYAINNHHDTIAQLLVDHGASVDIETTSGTSALNLISPGSAIYNCFSSRGYFSSPDFYDDGHNPLAPIPIDLEEGSDMHHRMMLESAYNLNLSMDHLKLDDSINNNGLGGINGINSMNKFGDTSIQDDFVWDRCKPDQMFVFAENDIPKILELSITQMEPKRTKGQKPVSADILFLCARYAHYYSGSPETVDNLLYPVCSRIRSIAMNKKQDISFLAFWLANCSLLLYYLRKDPGLAQATTPHQRSLAQLITDITILISQDAERRLDAVLDVSILDHETIPGLDDIVFQSDWKFFKKSSSNSKKNKTHQQEMEEKYGISTLSSKMKPSPRNLVSILNSVLFVCDLYEIHPIIVQELLSQILYWLGSVLFNRVMSNRKYLARSRAMQIRLNVSAIQDWAQQNNRQPEDTLSEFGDLKDVKKYPSVSQLCEIHFAPLVQLLQWLQIFTGFGNIGNETNATINNNGSSNGSSNGNAGSSNFSNVVSTLQQLTALNPTQLLHVAKKYRPEVDEKGLSKQYKQYLAKLNLHYQNDHAYSADILSQTILGVGGWNKRKGKKDEDENEGGLEDEKKGKGEKEEKRKSIENEVPKIIERKNGNVSEKDGQDAKDDKAKEEEPEEEEEEGEVFDHATQLANSSQPIPPSPSVVSPSSLYPGDGDLLSPSRSSFHQHSNSTDISRSYSHKKTYSTDSASGAAPLELYMDASAVLPFIVPTLPEMVFVWGYGLGGTRRAHSASGNYSLGSVASGNYSNEPVVPSVPFEFLDMLEDAIGNSNKVKNMDRYEDEYGDNDYDADSNDGENSDNGEGSNNKTNDSDAENTGKSFYENGTAHDDYKSNNFNIINPIFGSVTVPEPSAHKLWGGGKNGNGDEEELDEFKQVW